MEEKFVTTVWRWSGRKSKRIVWITSAICAAVLLIGQMFSGVPLLAQIAGTGTIQGTITDSNGAVVPGVTVTATNQATGLKETQSTSSGGTYVLSALPPGVYTVDAAGTGFRSIQQDHVTVNAISVVGLDLVLKTGAANQTVVVSGAPPDLQTQNGTLDTTIPNSTYSVLPLAMTGGPKSPVGFVSLVPGVTSNQNVRAYNFNGGAGNTSSIYLNGLPMTASELQGDIGQVTATTSTEIVDQFQVITGGVPAYYDGQGLVNLVLKSGTNQFHGDVFENIRNTAFDSPYYGQANAAVEHQNEFGGVVGGPIRRNRLFFFASYDGYRQNVGSAPTLYSLPTTAEQSGNFGALPYAIYDPRTTSCAAGVCTRQQFPGNIIGPISAISQSLQSYLPTLQNQNLQNNFTNQFVGGTKQNEFVGKLDATITSSNHASLLYQRGSSSPVGDSGLSGLPLPYANGRITVGRTYVGEVNDTQIITPRLLNLFGFLFLQDPGITTVPTASGNYPTKAGLTGLPAGVPSEGFPAIIFNGPDSPTQWGAQGGSSGQAFEEASQVEVFQDNLQWVHGKHSTTFGGQLTYQQENIGLPSVLNGISFSNTETAGFIPGTSTLDPNTGNAYASYLLGLVDNANATDTLLTKTGARYRNYALYVQDDWKVTPKLTVNLGLRYTIPKPFVEAHNRSSWLNATQPNPAIGGFPGALQFAGNGPDSCHCRTDVKTHYLTFGPRVGLAYAVNDKTVLRGSFSIVHFNGAALGGAGLSFGVSQLGYSTTLSPTSPDGGVTPAFNWNNGFPAYQHPPFFDPTLSTGYTTTIPAGGGIGYDRPETAGRAPYTEQWNLTLEQQLPASIVWNLTYAGSSSHFLAVGGGSGIYSDQIDPKYLALGGLLQQPVTPATLAQAQAIFPAIHLPYANFAGSIGQMLRPFPQYNGQGANFSGMDPWAAFATASYHALQTTLSKRMSNGLYFLAAYTWSKMMDEGAGTVNFIYTPARSAYNLKQERSTSLSDIPQQISLAYVYDLPFGQGRRFGGQSGALLNTLIGGWQLAGIQQYSSGAPLGTIGASCNTPYTSGGCYADYNPKFSGPVRINGGNFKKPGIPYLDYHAFISPASFTFGDTPRTMADSLRNPWSLNESIDLAKNFKVTDRVTFRFQADAFNIFNRTVFGGIGTNRANTGSFGFVGGQANTPRLLQLEGYIKF